MTTPCYRIAAGSAITDSSSSVKVVSVLSSVGSLDTTSNHMTYPYGGASGELIAFHNAVAAVGGAGAVGVVSAWVGLAPGWAGSGYGGYYDLNGATLNTV